MGATGFEPVKAEPADLQSAPFGHLGTRPGFAAFVGRDIEYTPLLGGVARLL